MRFRNALMNPRTFVTTRAVTALVLALGGSAATVTPAEATGAPAAVTVADSGAAAQAGPVADTTAGPAVRAATELADFGGEGGDGADDGSGTAAAWIDALSPVLVDALGYTPVVVDGVPSDPAGDCSSPVTLPVSFTAPCLSHDLGYDLLRVADRNGEDIPGEVRPALDRQLGARMRASCAGEGWGATGCRAMAGIAEAAVSANTWRQHNGAPVAESWPWS